MIYPSEFPTDYNIYMTPDYKCWLEDSFDSLDIVNIHELISGDCWGISIERIDGSLEIKHNFYYDQKYNLEYSEKSDRYRTSIIRNPEILFNDINVDDSIVIHMFQRYGYKCVITKINEHADDSMPEGWDIQFFISPHFSEPIDNYSQFSQDIYMMNQLTI
jgi:hypothetical protein